MLNLPTPLRIANAAAILAGQHGDITRRAHQQGLSRQALYRDCHSLLNALQHQDLSPQLQQLRDQVEDRRRRCAELQTLHQDAVTLSGEAGTRALTLVREALAGVWRASSLVEDLNSVARMQQGRHRKMTQGLLDLKRLYWNCRTFRTGKRRGKTP